MKITKRDTGSNYELFIGKLVFSYEYFHGIEHFDKLVDEIKTEDNYSKLTEKVSNDEEISRTSTLLVKLNLNWGKDLTDFFKTLMLPCEQMYIKFPIEHVVKPMEFIHYILYLRRVVLEMLACVSKKVEKENNKIRK